MDKGKLKGHAALWVANLVWGFATVGRGYGLAKFLIG